MTQPQIANSYDVPPAPDLGENVLFAEQASLAHIEDTTGGNRRLIEGWASLGGVDWQDMEISPSAFRDAVREYLNKNPVLLWDHARYLPIGKILMCSLNEQGLYFRAQVYRAEDYADIELSEADQARFPALESVAKKANEVWGLILRGHALGVSIGGTSRKKEQIHSTALGRKITRVIELLLYEISITPTQVHPGARLRAANLLAKALDLPSEPKRSESMKPNESVLREALAAYETALRTVADEGGEIPPDVVATQIAITKALHFEDADGNTHEVDDDPDAHEEGDDAVTKALEQENAALRERLAALGEQPAPVKNRTSNHQAPASSRPRPINGGESHQTRITKALDLAVKKALNDPKAHDVPSATDMMWLIFNRGALNGNITLHQRPGTAIAAPLFPKDRMDDIKALVDEACN